MKDSTRSSATGSHSSWIEPQCEQFVQAWKSGQTLRIEDLGSTGNLLAELHLFAAQDAPAEAEEHLHLSQEAADRAGVIFGRFYDPKHSREKQADREPMHGLATSMVMQAILCQESDPADSQRLAGDAAELIVNRLGSEPMLTRYELVTLAMARSMQGNASKALLRLQEAEARGENTSYRFERHRNLGFAALAGHAELGPKFDKLLKLVADRIVPANQPAAE